MSTPWDQLAHKFNTYKGQIDDIVADNIEIAWPVILGFIQEQFPNSKGLRALDYGCGTGMFCQELNAMGFQVTGIDLSSEMIKIANKNLGGQIEFYNGDSSLLNTLGQFDLITSQMVFQFIENLEAILLNIFKSLNENGVLIFSVHRPEYLEKSGVKNTMKFGNGTIVNIFGRPAQDYDMMLKKLGMQKLFQAEPVFTSEFIEKYKPKYVTDVSEYLILAYKKIV